MSSKGLECTEWLGHISAAAQRLVALANEKKCRIWMNFNDTELYAYPGESPLAVIDRWDRDREAQQAAYLASPEYKAKRRSQITRQIAELQQEYDSLT